MKKPCISKSGNDANSGQKPWCWKTKKLLALLVLLISGIFLPAPAAARPGSLYYHAAPQPIIVHIFAQTGGACGAPGAHCTVLSWTASTSAAACSPTSTPPCTFGYNVFEGTAAGGESSTPLNTAPITGNTYVVAVTLTNSPQTFFYTVGAVETVGTVTALSLTNSGEVSASFPGAPAPPPLPTATPH